MVCLRVGSSTGGVRSRSPHNAQHCTSYSADATGIYTGIRRGAAERSGYPVFPVHAAAPRVRTCPCDEVTFQPQHHGARPLLAALSVSVIGASVQKDVCSN